MASWNNMVSRFLKTPLLWGALASISFYAVVLQPKFHGTLVHKYTTEHITEYVIVVLFFWSSAHLIIRFLGLGREREALGQDLIPPFAGPEPATNAGALCQKLEESPWLQETILGKRLRLALKYVSERASADGFREYLLELSERDANETHASYGFPRFVAGVTPVLGLLGTVVHFGSALSGMASDQLMAQLGSMVMGMGTAFNTTCVALSASITTMLVLFLVERHEDNIVKDVNSLLENELLNRFATTDLRIAPFLDAVKSAQQTTLATMQAREQAQLDLWSSAISTHATQMHDTVEQLDKINAANGQMAKLFTADERLLELQARLADNLALLRESQEFDQAVHGLTAAIHMLTARHSQLSKAA
jgi:biopolymer transport protein ExbB/TolQ